MFRQPCTPPSPPTGQAAAAVFIGAMSGAVMAENDVVISAQATIQATVAIPTPGLTVDQIDTFEVNEAFATVVLAGEKELQPNPERVNPNGGAIALGHPLGMSGARLVTTAAFQLQRSAGTYALCTMCIGVGQGIAMIIERP